MPSPLPPHNLTASSPAATTTATTWCSSNQTAPRGGGGEARIGGEARSRHVVCPFRTTNLKFNRSKGTYNVAILASPLFSLPHHLPYKLAFSENGITPGYLLETTPNSTYPYYFIAVDASGLPIDPTALLDGAVSGISLLLMQLASVTHQFGKAAWDFFKCIGVGAVMTCWTWFYSCLASGTLPWFCDTGLACVRFTG